MPANPYRPINVFIVEDVKLLRLDLHASLQAIEGFEIAGMSESGEDAIEKIRSQKPDVILMDIGLSSRRG